MKTRSKAGITASAIVVFVLGVFVVADRVAMKTAEHRIAEQLRTTLGGWQITTRSDPEVDIGGFPFLTQVVDGRYEKLTITLDQPKIHGAQLGSLRLVASSVQTSAHGMFKTPAALIADKVTGTATLTWEAIRPLLELAGMPPGADLVRIQLTSSNGRVQLRVPVSNFGLSFALVVRGRLTVEGATVRLQLDYVGSDSGSLRVVQDLISRYKDKLSASIHVPAMPYNLVLNRIEISASGLLVTAIATNLNLNGTGA